MSEQQGVKFGAAMGAETLAALRAKSGDELLKVALKTQPWFSPNLDGYVLPRDVYTVFDAGKQAHVPLLAGWNADEVRGGVVLAKQKPTAQSFADDARKRFGEQADAILKAYPAGTDAEALESAAALASDLFIGEATWKWIEMHSRTGRRRSIAIRSTGRFQSRQTRRSTALPRRRATSAPATPARSNTCSGRSTRSRT